MWKTKAEEASDSKIVLFFFMYVQRLFSSSPSVFGMTTSPLNLKGVLAMWSLHEQIKQMEVAVEHAAQSSSRRSNWQFMGARDAGAKEELNHVYCVSERTEGNPSLGVLC
ncbi:unnamed protein product [Lactuca virosa]|uniref:Uncharacterized protein n=1 Tax=Lactuca virosa TaxID=75947 RepID=A0AAU9LJM8_9ASTR|nr:unnamed protein product [Lactuca virosa]